MQVKSATIGLGVLTYLFFQGLFSIANHHQYFHSLAVSTGALQVRIALDIDNLELANPRLNSVTDVNSVKQYLHSVNQHLEQQSASVRLLGLNGVSVETTQPYQPSIRILQTGERSISLEVGHLPWSLLQSFSPVPFLLTLIFSGIGYRLGFATVTNQKIQNAGSVAQRQVKLIINLHQKTISNGLDDTGVKLSNKPFCFYVALVDYCLTHSAPRLSHGQEVPEDIIKLANRYFYRLIELGHTKRKKPDFSTNLDKTLSEIRATLDEVYIYRSDEKSVFYPPKAQGEGSRSKLHNYALVELTDELVEIIGK